MTIEVVLPYMACAALLLENDNSTKPCAKKKEPVKIKHPIEIKLLHSQTNTIFLAIIEHFL